MSAFKKVVEHGLNWIETDVDILGDGTAIICHDTTLDRTTNKTGGYYELTAKDLPSIDAGSWFSPEFAGEPLPTLHQLVDFMNETGLNANIEIKSKMCIRDRSLPTQTRLRPQRTWLAHRGLAKQLSLIPQ